MTNTNPVYNTIFTLEIFILFSFSFIFLWHCLKIKKREERLIMLGFTCVCFTQAITQFLFYIGVIILDSLVLVDLLMLITFVSGMSIFFIKLTVL